MAVKACNGSLNVSKALVNSRAKKLGTGPRGWVSKRSRLLKVDTEQAMPHCE